MKITDEMVDVAWKALDDALNCKLDGTEYCYGDHTPMKHALEQVFAISHAAGQEVVDCVRSSELWYAIDEAKNPADFLARAIAILQRSNMAMVDNTAVLEPAVARSEGEES